MTGGSGRKDGAEFKSATRVNLSYYGTGLERPRT